MTRCRSLVGLAGSVALALLAACGSEVPPPQQPTSTFESRVGEPTPRVEPAPTAQSLDPGVPGGVDPLAGMPPTSTPGADLGTPPTTPSGPSEREMCDALLVDAKLHVEDIQGGAALVITPKTGGDIDALKQAARTIESKMPPAGMTTPPAGTSTSGTIPPSGTSPGGTTGTTTGASATGTSGAATGNAPGGQGSPAATDVAPADACLLFDLGRQGARASVAEQQRSVRILLTASDPASVKPLRARMRELVRSLSAQPGKAGPGSQTGKPADKAATPSK